MVVNACAPFYSPWQMSSSRHVTFTSGVDVYTWLTLLPPQSISRDLIAFRQCAVFTALAVISLPRRQAHLPEGLLQGRFRTTHIIAHHRQITHRHVSTFVYSYPRVTYSQTIINTIY